MQFFNIFFVCMLIACTAQIVVSYSYFSASGMSSRTFSNGNSGHSETVKYQMQPQGIDIEHIRSIHRS